MDTVVSVMLNLTNNSLTREDLTLATYKELISGWGYIPSPQQVNWFPCYPRSFLYSQDVWLNTTVSYLYEVLNNKTTDDSSEFDDLTKQFPDYGFSICTNNSYACWSKLNQGQNFYSHHTIISASHACIDFKE